MYGETARSTSDRLRPLAFSNSSILLIFGAASAGERLKPIQPSPYSATRRNAGPLSPPNHTGTRLWVGFGELNAPRKLTNSPLYEACSCDHSSRIASIYSRVRWARRSQVTPIA